MMRFGEIVRLVAVLFALGATAGLAGCSTNPATGGDDFTLMSASEEVALGRSQHPQILEEFGGEYADPEIRAYVDRIGRRLVAGTETPDAHFTFTVLDSPIVNAFAVPGGYVYVTRGLLALANDEAELAGVIGHEIGHVTARHGAQRHSRNVIVGLGAGLLGAIIGNAGASELLNLGAGLYLRSYSREQEFEADSLGLRYLARADYDPDAMAGFLDSLGAKSRLDARLMGLDSNPDAYNLLSTHPRTADRVREAEAAALGAHASGGARDRDAYLSRLDGLLYGDDPDEGFVRGRRFVHPKLRFEFTVPPGFSLINGQTHVSALGPNGAKIRFDMGRPWSGPLTRYLTDEWARGAPLVDVQAIQVNGLEGATAAMRLVRRDRTPIGDLRLVALRDGDALYRFQFFTQVADTYRLSEALRRMTYSFRLLDAGEADQLKPYRIRLHRTEPGQSVAELAQWMPEGPEPEARFRVLNGLAPDAELRPGTLVKYVGY